MTNLPTHYNRGGLGCGCEACRGGLGCACGGCSGGMGLGPRRVPGSEVPGDVRGRWPKVTALLEAAQRDPARYPDLSRWLAARAPQETGLGWVPIVMAIISGVSAVAGIAQGEQAKKLQKEGQKKALKQNEELAQQQLAIDKAVADAQIQALQSQGGMTPAAAQQMAPAIASDIRAQKSQQQMLLLAGGIGLAAILLAVR